MISSGKRLLYYICMVSQYVNETLDSVHIFYFNQVLFMCLVYSMNYYLHILIY